MIMEISKREGECSQDVFWDCVDEIGWPVESASLTKAAILRAWTPEFGASFRKILEKKTLQVHEVFVEHERRNLSERQRGMYSLSDDRISDFSNHVVGLGEKVFEEEISNPKKLFGRACNSDYKESFSYVIPYEPSWHGKTFEQWASAMGYDLCKGNYEPLHDDGLNGFDDHVASLRENYQESIKGDWRKIEPDHYAKWANQISPKCSAFLSALKNPATEDEKTAVNYCKALIQYLDLLIGEDTDDALKLSEEALRSWWGLYHIAEDVGALRSVYAKLLPTSGSSRYSGENLINDHRQYMGNLPGFRCRFHLEKIRSTSG